MPYYFGMNADLLFIEKFVHIYKAIYVDADGFRADLVVSCGVATDLTKSLSCA